MPRHLTSSKTRVCRLIVHGLGALRDFETRRSSSRPSGTHIPARAAPSSKRGLAFLAAGKNTMQQQLQKVAQMHRSVFPDSVCEVQVCRGLREQGLKCDDARICALVGVQCSRARERWLPSCSVQATHGRKATGKTSRTPASVAKPGNRLCQQLQSSCSKTVGVTSRVNRCVAVCCRAYSQQAARPRIRLA